MTTKAPGSNQDTATALALAVGVGICVGLATDSAWWGAAAGLALTYVSVLARGLVYAYYNVGAYRRALERTPPPRDPYMGIDD
jgi:hypothetical protein